MLAAILSISLSTAPSPQSPPREDPVEAAGAADPAVVTLDCSIADKALADCKVTGDVDQIRSAAALKMASTLKVPDQVLDAGVSHVRLRLRITTETTATLPTAAPGDM